MLTEILTDFDAMFFLVSSQHVGNKFDSDMFNSDVRIACTDPYDRPESIILSCRGLLIFYTFPGVMLVEVLIDRSSSPRDVSSTFEAALTFQTFSYDPLSCKLDKTCSKSL